VFLFNYDESFKKRMFIATIEGFTVVDKSSINGEHKKKLVIFSKIHHGLYLSSYHMFKDNYLFGIGTKNFRYFCKRHSYNKYLPPTGSGNHRVYRQCFSHPHNTYLQLLAETGLIGTLPVICLLFFVVYKFFQYLFKYSLRSSLPSYQLEAQICLYTALLITLFPFVSTGNFFNNWLSTVYYLPLGFLFYLSIDKVYKV
jgi:O-antigen ligase